MNKEVTLFNLNKAYRDELFSSRIFWAALLIYIIGLMIMSSDVLVGGIVMLISALLMLNSDYKGRQEVVKRLRWVK